MYAHIILTILSIVQERKAQTLMSAVQANLKAIILIIHIRITRKDEQN